jgi:CelD/BcsL family acetyltransferase involved in cellulose biosynthesis
MPLIAEVVSAPDGVERLASAWWALLDARGGGDVMATPLWLGTWWRVFGGTGGRKLRLLALRDGTRLVGLAPLELRLAMYRPGIPFRRVELLGSGEREQDEICSIYLGVQAAPGHEAAVAEATAEALVRGAAGVWDEALLPSMAGDSPMPRLLADALARRGVDAELAEKNLTSTIPLPATWDAYLAALPSNRRQNVKRAIRLVADWAGGEPTVHRVTTTAELADGLRVLRRLHGERWHDDRAGGAFASPTFSVFHEAVMPQLFARGALDLYWLEARGEPIAARYNIVWHGRALAYLGGRSLALPHRLSPGIVAHAIGIQNAIARGLGEYDFLAGTRGHKKELALATRPLVEIRAVRARVREAARRAIHGAAQRVRELRQRRTQPPPTGDE